MPHFWFPHSIHSLFFMYFLDPLPKPDSPPMHVGTFPLSTTLLMPSDSTSPSSCTKHALFIHFLFCDLSPTLQDYMLLYGSMDGCYESFILLFVGMISFFYNTFWFEGVLPFSWFSFFYFHFWRFFFSFKECFQAHCFAQGSVLEYPEAVWACAMCHHLHDLGICLFNCLFFFFAFFAIGHIYLS